MYDNAEDAEAAFASITALTPVDEVHTAVLDRETHILAYSDYADLVGHALDQRGNLSFYLDNDLVNDGDHLLYNLNVPLFTESLRTTTFLFWLHDGYYFVASAPFVVYTR